MAKKRKQRRKVNFSDMRYPKSSKSKAAELALPDEVFWPAYYGECASGIVDQYYLQYRWHAIQCLEGGFEGDDERLLHARQVLVDMAMMLVSFETRYERVLKSSAFKERKASVEALTSSQKGGSMCEWESRAVRAELEVAWCDFNAFEQFHERM